MAQMTIQLGQVSRTTTEAMVRAHRVLIDRPVDKGGTDLGPMGGELFLAAIGGCFMSNLLAAIRARNSDVSDVRTMVIGTIESTPARFSAVEVHIEAKGSSEEIERLVDIADRGCIMMNTLRGKLDMSIRTRVAV
ncbi:MAG: OsmC family protein [Vicinamibacterales bacterium]